MSVTQVESQSKAIFFGKESKMTKIERYGWSTKDQPGQMNYLDKRLIEIDPKYQREANLSKVKEIAKSWSWIACGVIIVAKRGDQYFAMDGQHRVIAAMRREDIALLPCIVFEIDEIKEEAKGFLNANINRKPVPSIAAHKAKIVAGDAIAVRVDAMLERNGIEITLNTTAHKKTKSVALLYRLASQDLVALDQVITVVAKLCECAPIKEKLIDGIFYLHLHGLSVENKRFKDRLMTVGQERLIAGATRASAFYAKGGARVWAQGMLEEINKGLSRKFSMTDSVNGAETARS